MEAVNVCFRSFFPELCQIRTKALIELNLLIDQPEIRPSQNLQRKHGMQWSNEQITVECTMKAVLDDGVSANKAEILHRVPHSTLQVCLSGRVIHGRKPDPQQYLDAEEEASDIGYSKSRKDVLGVKEKMLCHCEVLLLPMAGGKSLKEKPYTKSASGRHQSKHWDGYNKC